MPDNPEKARRPQPDSIRHAQAVLEQLRAEDPTLADTLKGILPGYALQLEKNDQPCTPEILLEDARKGVEWLKEQKPVKAVKAAQTPIEIYNDILKSFGGAPHHDVCTPKHADQPLIEAAQDGNLDKLISLHRDGADITARVVGWAANRGHLDCFIYAYQNCTDIKDRDWLVAAAAYEHGRLDCIKYLHQIGAAHPSDFSDRIGRNTIRNGGIDFLTYMQQNGVDMKGRDDLANLASIVGRLDCLTYLHQNGADIKTEGQRIARLTAIEGHVDCLAYLHENGVDIIDDSYTVVLAARGGHLDCIKYLHQNGADITTRDNEAIRLAVGREHIDCLAYLHQNGADVMADKEVIEGIFQSNLFHSFNYLRQNCEDFRLLLENDPSMITPYMKGREQWLKIVHMDPPATLVEENPRFFKRATFEFLKPLLVAEGYKDDTGNKMAFAAARLFQTPDRAMQYLQQWGKPGKQPLHDLIHMIRLPSCDQFSIKDWGDAVLKFGPSMARLVTFADRVPSPERSSDGKTWSYVATRAVCAQFFYPKGPENPELAAFCSEHYVSERDFNQALEIVKQGHPATKNLPEISIEGSRFGMTGSKFYRLAPDDIRGLFLGEATGCCQSIGSHGHACAKYGFESENGGFYVVENDKGRIVSQTFAWRTEEGGMCFDTLETLGDNVTGEQWTKILQETAAELTQRQDHDIARLTVGMGGGTPKSLSSVFEQASKPAKPFDYKGYTEAGRQIVVWERKTPDLP